MDTFHNHESAENKIVGLRNEHFSRVKYYEVGDQKMIFDQNDIPLNGQVVYEHSPYRPHPSKELDAIIAHAGSPIEALAHWYNAVRSRIDSTPSVRLIPKKIQEAVGLELRQLFIDPRNDAVWKIEPINKEEGKITERIL